MRYNTYLIAAAVSALAATGASSAFAQAAAPAAPAAPAAAAPAAAGATAVTDPDAKYLIGSRAYSAGISGLDQRGCEESDKVYGTKPVAIDGYLYGGCLPKGADKNLDAVRVLLKAAQGTGQFRNVAYGFATQVAVYLVVGDFVPAMRMEGAGTWNGEKVKVRMDWDYRVPGVRFFVTHANGTTDITAMGDARVSPAGRVGHLEQPDLFGSGPINGVQVVAWKEKPIGVYSGASDMNPQDMLALSYLMPTNIILAARDGAATTLKASKAGRNDVLTVAVPRLGGANLVATLNGEGQPTHAEITTNGKKYTADFGNYLSDRGDYEVFMPHQIAVQVDGKPILDWQVEWHHTNPYVVFSVPSQVVTK